MNLSGYIEAVPALEEALRGKEIPHEIRTTLALVTVPYISFADQPLQGRIIVHQAVAQEVLDIFQELFDLRFPIEKIIPVAHYEWNDDASMEDNNSSAFNYRVIHGTSELSNHSYGLAIDINPRMNPYCARDGSILPPNAIHDFAKTGTLVPGSAAVRAFTSRGWEWGGDWQRKDWQHFEKKLRS